MRCTDIGSTKENINVGSAYRFHQLIAIKVSLIRNAVCPIYVTHILPILYPLWGFIHIVIQPITDLIISNRLDILLRSKGK